MNDAVKSVVRQLSPPILVTLARTVLRKEKQTPLKSQHEERNRDAKKDEIVLRDNVRLKLDPLSKYGWEYFCYRDGESVAEMNAFLERTRDKSRLLDIGAYDGIFSLVFAVSHPEKQVVAVDASPVGFARLLYNIHKNRATNITPVECALSDSPGELRMHYEWDHAIAAGTDNSASNFLTIEKRTGDDLCQSLSFSPDVIKIDVEGHEVKVLKGLSAVIERHRPLIFLEVHPARINEENDSADDIFAYIVTRSYRLASLDGQTLPNDSSSFMRFQRLLLVPS